MVMTNYRLYGNHVDIIMSNGRIFTVYFTPDSGKVYYRSKIGTLSDVKHTGIYLGVDSSRKRYFMHNHYLTKQPSIVSEHEFSQGLPLFLYEGESINTPKKTIELGLEQIFKAEPYSWHSYNCQSFVNKARNNQSSSEDVDKWAKGIGVTLLLVLGIKAINS